jgi:hypothetical protein
MPGEIVQQALEMQQAVQPLFLTSGDMENYGQSTAAWIGEGIGTVALLGAAFGGKALMSRFSHGGGSHDKPAEIREARVRFVKPWESGLLLKNSNFYKIKKQYKSVPVLDEAGLPVLVDNEKQYEEQVRYKKEFHKIITPGFNGALNMVLFWRKMMIVNNLPDEVTFPLTHIASEDERMFNLTGGMTWSHVRALDENKQPMYYEYLLPSADGKRPAGPISAADVLHNAINTGATRAEAARQLALVVLPEVVAQLEGNPNPQATAKDPEFFKEIEKAVHDRFLDRGSVLVQLGVAANANPETSAADKLARPMKKRNKILAKKDKGWTEQFTFGEEDTEDDETAAVAAYRTQRSRLHVVRNDEASENRL